MGDRDQKQQNGDHPEAFHDPAPPRSRLLRGLQRIPGRLLLRFLLRRPLAPGRLAADLHLDDEALVVIRPLLCDDVVLREGVSAALCQLLQRGLVVVEEEIVFFDSVEIVLEGAFDEAPRRVDTAVEEDRRDGGFEQIREQ